MKVSRSTIALTGFAGLLVGAGIFFAQWSNSSVSTTKSDRNDSEVLSSQITLMPFSATYFSTLIPDTYIVKSQIENARIPIMGSYLFKDSNVTISDQLAVTIGKPGGESITGIAPVKLRASKPNEYTRATFPNMPNGAIAYQRINEYEKAVFWMKDSRYIAVVVSGSPQRLPQLDQTLQAVLANWQ